ncbi:hypothetical protein MKX03_018711 [Papaver bracteatum]|nr:hypothetical protein MKX03_018711 [Papaver bracteatum]
MIYVASDWICYGCEVEVYSLRSNSWKKIPYDIAYDFLLGDKAIKHVVYNGALHWVGSSCVSLREGWELSITESIVIISFDVETDSFKEVALTRELQKSLSYDHSTIHDHWGQLSTDIFLGTFGGCLAILQGGQLYSARNNNGDVSIWVMKDYGVKESWGKMFSVSTQSMGRSVKYSRRTVIDFRNDMILFLKDKSSHKNSLVLYDLKHEKIIVVNTGGVSLKRRSYVDTYVENLGSLNSGIYLGSKLAIDGAS